MKGKRLLACLVACLALFLFAIGASAEGYWQWDDDGGYYYWLEDGVMLTNQWKEIDGEWYYFGANGAPYENGVYTINGKMYGFSGGGCMYHSQTFTVDHYDEDLGYWVVDGSYRADSKGVLYVNNWYYETWGNGADYEYGTWYYYGADGKMVYDTARTIDGKQYVFQEDGSLAKYGAYTLTINGVKRYFAVDEETFLAYECKNNAWVKAGDNWYCVSNGKFCRDGIYTLGGKKYYFYWDGCMAYDTGITVDHYDEELEEWITDGEYRAGSDGVLYASKWYYETWGNGPDYEWGDWYYYGADGKMVCGGLFTIGGKQYLFSEGGWMYEQGVYEMEINSSWRFFVIDENDVAYECKNNAWLQVGDDWYCVSNGAFCREGVYTLGGKQYYFDYDGTLIVDLFFSVWDDEIYEYYYYYAQPGNGVLAKNQWVQFKNSDYGEDGWYYFGSDCRMYRDDIYTIGGKRYAFDYNGRLRTDEIVQDEYSGKYYYATPSSGALSTEKSVWKAINGDWYYLSADSSLKEGWLESNGKWYYMEPEMQYASFQVDGNGYLHLLAENGVSKKLTTTGFIDLGYETVYLEKGKLAVSKWISVGGKWYYANEYASVLKDTNWGINGKYYFFNKNGVMQAGGWVQSTGGSWYYANANGQLLTEQWLSSGGKWYYFTESGYMAKDGVWDVKGVKYCFAKNGALTKGWYQDSEGTWYWADKSGKAFIGLDNTGYVFDSWGALVKDGICSVNGTCYVTDASGKKLAAFTSAGWYKVGKDWYLVIDDYGYLEVCTDSYYYDDQGRFFSFENNGKMRTNQFYGGYYLGVSGNALTGWFKVGNNWYYGNPDDCGYLYNNWIYYIGDKAYAFDDTGKLIQSKTYFDWSYDEIITTDVNGVVIKRTAANGWVYEEHGSYGEAYYYTNGDVYNGWLGNYYIDHGRMCIDETVNVNGKYYYLNEKGLKLSAGWHDVGSWIYAKSDGSLAYNEWQKLGGKWYYFNDIWMVSDSLFTIDGKQHMFAANGVWMGESVLGTKDGWKQYNGDWYFVMAGQAVRYRSLLINNNWYYFDYNGKMVKNGFCFDGWSGVGIYYYGSNGARVNYVGWQKIDGKWVHFNDNHTLSSWVYENGEKKYYIAREYGEGDKMVNVGMVTGTQVIGSRIYRFNNSGVLTETVTKQGWYKVDGDWYYVDKDGYVVYEAYNYEINGAYYAFDYSGKMIANEICYENATYYDAGGKAVTKQGWYKVNGEWIYVLANGKVAMNGVFRINGKDYYFDDGYMV